MTMLFMDSCQHYTGAQSNRKWDSVGATNPTVAANSARHNSSMKFTSTTCWVTKTVTASGTLTVGFAFRPTNNGGALNPIVCFLLNGSVQCTITYNASNQIQAWRGNAGGTSLGTSTSAVGTGAFTYLEVKVTFSTTVGTIDVHANGVSILSLSGVNNALAGGTTANAFGLNYDGTANHGWSTWECQDIYCLNSLGSHNTTFLGDVYVEALYPSGPGANSGWAIGGTGPAATRWQSVNETTPDDNSTYISSSTPSDICDFTLTTTSLTPVSIAALQWCVCVEKTNAGTSQVEAEVSISGTSYSPGTYNVTSNYVYGLIVSETNPTGTSAWVNADLTGNYFGVELVF